MVANDSLRIVASMPAFKFGPEALLALKFEDFKIFSHAEKIDFANSKQIARWPALWFFSHTKVENQCVTREPFTGSQPLQQYVGLLEADKQSQLSRHHAGRTTCKNQNITSRVFVF